MDAIGNFLSECVERGTSGTISKQEMFQAFDSWGRENGEDALPMNKFGARLKVHGIEDGKTGSKRFWKDVKLLKSEWDTLEEVEPVSAGGVVEMTF